MDGPQLEDGYTRIANEIVGALARIRISGQEWQVLWVILRKTYGWNKKVDRIALSQFEEMTGIPRKKCFQLLKQLSSRKIITKSVPQKGDSYIITYGFNKNYNAWVSVPHKGYSPPKRRQGVTHNGDGVSPKKGTTKDTSTKDTIQKKELFVRFWNLYPKRIAKKKCEPKFLKLSLETMDLVFKALKWQIPYWNSRGQTGEFVPESPNPETYLNQGRWEDGEVKIAEELSEADQIRNM